MRRLLVLLAVIALIVMLVAGPLAFAQESSSVTTNKEQTLRQKFQDDLSALKTERKTLQETRKTERADQQKIKTIQMAEKQLMVRSKVLDEQKRRINQARCSQTTSVDVSSLASAAINKANTTLDTALAAVKSAPSAETARQELKKAIESTRIFAVLNPAISGLCAAGRVTDRINGPLTEVVTKLKTEGKTTQNLEKYLAEAKVSAQSAVNSYTTTLNDPSNPNAKTTLTTAREQMKTTRSSLATFRDELEKLTLIETNE